MTSFIPPRYRKSRFTSHYTILYLMLEPLLWRFDVCGVPPFIAITPRFTLILNNIWCWSSSSGYLMYVEYLLSLQVLPGPLWYTTVSDDGAPTLENWGMWSTSLHCHYSQCHSVPKLHLMMNSRFGYLGSGESFSQFLNSLKPWMLESQLWIIYIRLKIIHTR